MNRDWSTVKIMVTPVAVCTALLSILGIWGIWTPFVDGLFVTLLFLVVSVTLTLILD